MKTSLSTNHCMLRQGFFAALLSAIALPLLLRGTVTDSANNAYAVTMPSGCVTPPPDMLSWWPGDGNFDDIQGGNNGTQQGNVTFAPGEVGQAFSFSGDGYVSADDSPSLNPTAITIDLWISTTNATVQGSLVSKFQHNNGTATDDSYYLGINPGGGPGTLQWQLDTPSGDFILNSPMLNIFDGQFHFVAVTYDGTSMFIYVDGQSLASRSANGPIRTTTTSLYLGAALDGGTVGRFFVGQLDEVEIFSRALTQGEIQAIFNAGSAGKCRVGISPTPTTTATPTATATPTSTGTPTATPPPRPTPTPRGRPTAAPRP